MTTAPEPATNRPRAWVRLGGRAALLWLACALVVLVGWLRATFGDVSLGQILFHWRYLGGSSSIAPIIARDCVVTCVFGPLLLAAFLLWLELRVVRPRWRQLGRRRLRRFGATAAAWLPGIVVAASLATLASRTSAMQFLSPIGSHDFFATHYIAPSQDALRQGQRKNLVLVYVESLETSYSRRQVFGRDLLASLADLHPVTFEAYDQMPGTGWTIAAIVSTQCGVPLEPVGFLDPHSQGELAKAFMPGAVCLGDLLAARGYRNVFMGGASLAFSGKGKFLRGHHYEETWGREEWLAHGIPRSRISGWGLHDDDLFVQAKVRLRELHDAGRPFNLTLLTVDTHWPSGYLSPSCRQRGAGELEGIVECTSEQVADLVKFVRAEGWDADTQIVVLGDHLTPPNTLSDKLAQVPKRSIYNAFYSRTPPTPNRTTIVHFDLLPTLLDFIGLPPVDGRAGLGYAAFGPPARNPPTPQSRAELSDKVLTPSKAYVGLWEPLSATAAPVSLQAAQTPLH